MVNADDILVILRTIGVVWYAHACVDVLTDE